MRATRAGVGAALTLFLLSGCASLGESSTVAVDTAAPGAALESFRQVSVDALGGEWVVDEPEFSRSWFCGNSFTVSQAWKRVTPAIPPGEAAQKLVTAFENAGLNASAVDLTIPDDDGANPPIWSAGGNDQVSNVSVSATLTNDETVLTGASECAPEPVGE